jgi:hypothetical protein
MLINRENFFEDLVKIYENGDTLMSYIAREKENLNILPEELQGEAKTIRKLCQDFKNKIKEMMYEEYPVIEDFL